MFALPRLSHYFSPAVRTDPRNKGAGGISVLVIKGDTSDLTRTELKKMGRSCSDTAHLHFNNCRVPVKNLVGVESQSFKTVMAKSVWSACSWRHRRIPTPTCA